MEFYSRSGSGGTLFSVIIQDESGSIEITFFNEKCSQFSEILKEEVVYTFQKLKAKVITNNNYKLGSSDFSLTAGFDTDVFASPSDVVPEKNVIFTKFSSLQCDERVNVYGIVLKSKEVADVGQHKKLDITVGDAENSLELTLWNEVATKKGNVKEGEIISIEHTTVKNFRGNIQCSGGFVTSFKAEELDKKLAYWWTNSETKELPSIENKVKIKNKFVT